LQVETRAAEAAEAAEQRAADHEGGGCQVENSPLCDEAGLRGTNRMIDRPDGVWPHPHPLHCDSPWARHSYRDDVATFAPVFTQSTWYH